MMNEASDTDKEFVKQLLGGLRDQEPELPEGLTERTIRKVQALITARDLIDLTTVVFVLRFCAPLVDLVAAALGATNSHEGKRRTDG